MSKISNDYDDAYLFISRFPPPYGGVSNQVKWLGEYLVKKSSNRLVIFNIDLKSLTLHQYFNGQWNEYRLFKIKGLYLSSLFSINILIKYIVKNLKSLFRNDGYNTWRLTLVIFAHAMSHLLSGARIRLVYSFHFGAPSLVGGLLANKLNAAHITAVFGEGFTNYYKLHSQKDYLLSNAGKFVSCSNHCGEMMRAIDQNIDFSILYYGSNLQVLNDLRKSSRKKFDGETTIMFLGRMEPEMGIRYFIDVAKALSNCSSKNFNFIVCGQEGVESSYVAEQQLYFGRRMRVEVSAPFELRDKLLVESDVLIVPSTNERACFGLAIVEGLVAGCRVYARDIGGQVEPFLGEKKFLFGRDCPAEKLAARIVTDHGNAEIAEASKALQERVLRKFDLEACLAEQKQFISKYLSKKELGLKIDVS